MNTQEIFQIGLRMYQIDDFQVKTSTCEQFNSYILQIISSGKLLNQVHFVFYIEFLVLHWKKNSFQNVSY